MAGVGFRVPNEDPDMTRTEFFRLGFQYYIAGRFAFFARQIKVAANILHHAIEMCIKGHLFASLGLEEVKNYGHGLPSLWEALKHSVPASEELSSLDHVVQSLHKFETIRYPGPDFSRGMDLFVSPISGVRAEITEDRIGPLPRFDFNLEDIDRLIREILRVASINPRFYTGLVPSDCKAFLTRGNPFASDW